MRKMLLLLVVLCLPAVIALPAQAESLPELLKQSKAARAAFRKKVNDHNLKNIDLVKQANLLKIQKQILEQPAMNEQQIIATQNKIEQLELQIYALKKQIELSKITDPEARKREITAVDEALKDVAEVTVERAKPLQTEIAEFAKQFTEQNKQMITYLSDYVRVPNAAVSEITQATMNVNFHAAQIDLTWMDKDRNAEAVAQLVLSERPDPLPKGTQVLAEVMTLTSSQDKRLVGYVGPFLLTFVVASDEYKGRDKLESFLVQLLDLQGIALMQVAQ